MTSRSDRRLPNWYVHHFLVATQAETGDYGLRLMLRNAGLDQYIVEFPPENKQAVMLASEFAALQAAMRQYFGNGARGALIRIGRLHWKNIYETASVIQRAKLTAGRQMPALPAGRIFLNHLAARLQGVDGNVSVHLMDRELIFMDTSSDSTVEQSADSPICWATLGMLQAAMTLATGQEQNIEEISCRASGAAACRFRIQLI